MKEKDTTRDLPLWFIIDLTYSIPANKLFFNILNREDIFVTSKLWGNSHHPDDVELAVKKSLSDLGLAYLDLYLIHWPHAFKRGDALFPKKDDGSVEVRSSFN